MKRRDFFKALLGGAAGAALPNGEKKSRENHPIRGQVTEQTLSCSGGYVIIDLDDENMDRACNLVGVQVEVRDEAV